MTNWQTPPTIVTNDLVSAATLNVIGRDNPLYLKEQSDLSTRRLYRDSTARANVGTGVTDLGSFTLPGADSALGLGLWEDQQSLRVEAFGQFANNANTKTYLFVFGTLSITLAGITTAGVDTWRIEATVVRVSATSQKVSVRISIGVGTGTDRLFYNVATENLANPVVVKIQGQSSVAGGDITEQDFVVFRQ